MCEYVYDGKSRRGCGSSWWEKDFQVPLLAVAFYVSFSWLEKCQADII